MALSAKFELRQGQQLVMTPQLQQAIRLLQLSNMELSQFVEAELERNPLLEIDEAAEFPVKAEREPDHEPAPEVKQERHRATTSGSISPSPFRPMVTLDADYENSFADTGAPSAAPDGADSGWASMRQRSSSFIGRRDQSRKLRLQRDVAA